MTPEAMAALHATAFEGPACWSAAAFDQILALHGAFVATEADAFLVGRAIVGEAELLTLVVARPRRRQGVGRGLLARFDALARARGAAEAFLEVASSNASALALYAGAGWAEAGQRPGYYAGADALILRKAL